MLCGLPIYEPLPFAPAGALLCDLILFVTGHVAGAHQQPCFAKIRQGRDVSRSGDFRRLLPKDKVTTRLDKPTHAIARMCPVIADPIPGRALVLERADKRCEMIIVVVAKIR